MLSSVKPLRVYDEILSCLSHLKHLMSISCRGRDARRYDASAKVRQYAGVSMRTNRFPLLVTCAALLWGSAASSQSEPKPRPLRYVSEWEVPRDRWNEFETSADHTIRPLMELQMKQQSILSWGIYRSMLIQDGAATHGLWFEVPFHTRRREGT